MANIKNPMRRISVVEHSAPKEVTMPRDQGDVAGSGTTLSSIFSTIWQRLGSIQLTVVLCLLLAIDLALGYLCLVRREHLFAPLNEVGLVEWIETYGYHNLAYTTWLFILLALLVLLCVNTFVCTTDRLVRLFRARARLWDDRQEGPPIGERLLLFKLAPHIMHYALIVILAGYLGSYLFARVLVCRTLVPGASMTLPNTAGRIIFESLDSTFYEGHRLAAFKNRVIRPRAFLILDDGKQRQQDTLMLNQPIHFLGYGIFLKDFSPKRRGSMSNRVRIDLTIRKDPGVWCALAGMLLFAIGLLLYLIEWTFFKKAKKAVS